jgi:tryptophan 2,3-dioxygenase
MKQGETMPSQHESSQGCPFSSPGGNTASSAGSPLTYNNYLKVSELISLQICQSDPPHHDETLFIVIHQAYELWFKLILHELDSVFYFMTQDKVRRANFYMKRVVNVMRLLVQQIQLLETMSPKDFLGFRYKLNPASGFQSMQFREIEIAGGMRDTRLLEHFQSDPVGYAQLKKRYEAPSLPEAFYELLRRRGFKLPVAPPDADQDLQEQTQELRIKELLKLYNEEDDYPDLHDLAESFIDFDQCIFLWRMNHVTVVERMIGFKKGTGGSDGVAYLRTTLDKRCFSDLWKLRTYLEL